MTITALKQLLDSCFTAKRVIETLPALPPGMKPRHIHVLDAVHALQERNGSCRVSDVSARLNVTLPSVTKLVQELENRKLLEKRADSQDRRVILLSLTPDGLDCFRRYVQDMHARWSAALPDISDEQVKETVHILNRLLETMPDRV